MSHEPWLIDIQMSIVKFVMTSMNASRLMLAYIAITN